MGIRRDEVGTEILNARFTKQRFLPGYNEVEVDEFLDRLRAAVVRGEPVEQLNRLVDSASFTTRRGAYGETEVDDFLDRVLARCADTTTPLVASSSAASTPPEANKAEAAQRPITQLESSSGSALIEPRPGLLTRLGRKLRNG